MGFAHTLDGTTYSFPDLKALLAKASPRRSGDELAGIAAGTGAERVAAQMALADLPLRAFLNDAVVPYESDEVTRLIVDSHNRVAFAPIAAQAHFIGGKRDRPLKHLDVRHQGIGISGHGLPQRRQKYSLTALACANTRIASTVRNVGSTGRTSLPGS